MLNNRFISTRASSEEGWDLLDSETPKAETPKAETPRSQAAKTDAPNTVDQAAQTDTPKAEAATQTDAPNTTPAPLVANIQSPAPATTPRSLITAGSPPSPSSSVHTAEAAEIAALRAQLHEAQETLRTERANTALARAESETNAAKLSAMVVSLEKSAGAIEDHALTARADLKDTQTQLVQAQENLNRAQADVTRMRDELAVERKERIAAQAFQEVLDGLCTQNEAKIADLEADNGELKAINGDLVARTREMSERIRAMKAEADNARRDNQALQDRIRQLEQGNQYQAARRDELLGILSKSSPGHYPMWAKRSVATQTQPAVSSIAIQADEDSALSVSPAAPGRS